MGILFSGYLKYKSNKTFCSHALPGRWKKALFDSTHLSQINMRDTKFASLMSKASSVSLSLPTACRATAGLSLCISHLLFPFCLLLCFFFCYPHRKFTQEDPNQTKITEKHHQMHVFFFKYCDLQTILLLFKFHFYIFI